MAGNERLDDLVGSWLQESAPSGLPQRVLTATFERTRRTRQELDWRRVLGTAQKPRLISVFGVAAVIVLATVLAINVIPTLGPAATPAPSTSPRPTTSMWPQANLEEVRQAQALVDAGDPTYAWQLHVDGLQLGQNHPCSGATFGCWRHASNGGSGEIFTRFLEQELGWEAYAWDEAFAHRAGLNGGDVVFVRCAPGVANPLYPTDAKHPGCAPTIDELRYETVKVTVAQPGREGPTGIWAVTGWEKIAPAMQRDPRIVQAEATALLDSFLQARIDGHGAEALASFPANADEELVDPKIPLLYATSTGARYERAEFDVVEGPVWPDASTRYLVRLFAENGKTKVEQRFSLDWDATGQLRLVYDLADGSFFNDTATTENGKAVPMTYGFLDGLVTYRAADPLGPSHDDVRAWNQLAIDGLLPDDESPRRILLFVANPSPSGLRCQDAPASTDAEALARSIEADPSFDGPAPVSVTIGGRPALRIDGAVATAIPCGAYVEPAPTPGGIGARLYLLDLPGTSARVLAISINADLDSFETVLASALPVVDSIEFHAP